jgi:hypothetical protein
MLDFCLLTLCYKVKYFNIVIMTVRVISAWIACWTCVPRFSRLPGDGTPVPKHVGVDTYHELYFIVFCSVHLLVDILNIRQCTV